VFLGGQRDKKQRTFILRDGVGQRQRTFILMGGERGEGALSTKVLEFLNKKM